MGRRWRVFTGSECLRKYSRWVNRRVQGAEISCVNLVHGAVSNFHDHYLGVVECVHVLGDYRCLTVEKGEASHEN